MFTRWDLAMDMAGDVNEQIGPGWRHRVRRFIVDSDSAYAVPVLISVAAFIVAVLAYFATVH